MRATAVERLVADARDAAALDTLDHAAATDAFASAILVTDSQELAQRAPRGTEVDLDAGDFDFGSRLRKLIRDHNIERPFYIGGGSLPLVSAEELAALAERLSTADEQVLSNNF